MGVQKKAFIESPDIVIIDLLLSARALRAGGMCSRTTRRDDQKKLFLHCRASRPTPIIAIDDKSFHQQERPFPSPIPLVSKHRTELFIRTTLYYKGPTLPL